MQFYKDRQIGKGGRREWLGVRGKGKLCKIVTSFGKAFYACLLAWADACLCGDDDE